RAKTSAPTRKALQSRGNCCNCAIEPCCGDTGSLRSDFARTCLSVSSQFCAHHKAERCSHSACHNIHTSLRRPKLHALSAPQRVLGCFMLAAIHPFESAEVVVCHTRAGRPSRSSPSGRSCGLEQLHQIALRILERRDSYRAVVRGILDELDPGVPQAFPIAREIVARETDHVPSRVGIGAVHLAMRAQPEPAEY